MFRNPRHPADQVAQKSALRPSTGRPPTPPLSRPQRTDKTPTKASVAMSTTSTPLLGRNRTISKSNSRLSAFSGGKTRAKPNGSILTFFKRAPSTTTLEKIDLDSNESLFIDDHELPQMLEISQVPTPPKDNSSIESSPETGRIFGDENELRFNEEPVSVKRQRVEGHTLPSSSSTNQQSKSIVISGPFLEDSDDDNGDTYPFGKRCIEEISRSPNMQLTELKINPNYEEALTRPDINDLQAITPFKYEPMSKAEQQELENIEDFIDEFPEEGEEYLERKWMEENEGIESGLEQTDLESFLDAGLHDVEKEKTHAPSESLNPTCPICNMSFDGVVDQVRHIRGSSETF